MSAKAHRELRAQSGEWMRIMLLTRQMLSAASDGDWEKVTRFEEERSELLHKAVANDSGDPDWLFRRISDLLESDRQIVAMASNARQRASGELISFRERARRLRGYTSTPSG